MKDNIGEMEGGVIEVSPVRVLECVTDEGVRKCMETEKRFMKLAEEELRQEERMRRLRGQRAEFLRRREEEWERQEAEFLRQYAEEWRRRREEEK